MNRRGRRARFQDGCETEVTLKGKERPLGNSWTSCGSLPRKLADSGKFRR